MEETVIISKKMTGLDNLFIINKLKSPVSTSQNLCNK
jgi:hypothetical protein